MLLRSALLGAAPVALLFALGAHAESPATGKAKGRQAVKKPEPVEDTRDVATVLQDCQEVASKREAFLTTFSQETFSALRNRSSRQSGTLSYRAPRSFRWEVTAPRKELYVSNGKDFWKYNETAKHAQKLAADLVELRFLDAVLRPGMLAVDFGIEPWVLSAPAVEPVKTPAAAASPSPVPTPKLNTGISELPPAVVAGKVYARLMPRGKSKQQAMYLVADKSSCAVEELRVFYENGNRSRIVFGKVESKNLPASQFDFVPPPGTAVDK
jgi:outer membrane lipoprotein-sorting protein